MRFQSVVRPFSGPDPDRRRHFGRGRHTSKVCTHASMCPSTHMHLHVHTDLSEAVAGEEEGEEVLQQRVLPLRAHVDPAWWISVYVMVGPSVGQAGVQALDPLIHPFPSLTRDVRRLLQKGRVAEAGAGAVGAPPVLEPQHAGVDGDGGAVRREDAVHEGVVVRVGVGGGLSFCGVRVSVRLHGGLVGGDGEVHICMYVCMYVWICTCKWHPP